MGYCKDVEDCKAKTYVGFINCSRHFYCCCFGILWSINFIFFFCSISFCEIPSGRSFLPFTDVSYTGHFGRENANKTSLMDQEFLMKCCERLRNLLKLCQHLLDNLVSFFKFTKWHRTDRPRFVSHHFRIKKSQKWNVKIGC